MGLGAGCVEFRGETKRLSWSVSGITYAIVELPIQTRVLDVGGGQDPHPAADVVVDKFIDDNRHRMGQIGLMKESILIGQQYDGREVVFKSPLTLICADVTDLPFPDKSFGFIITRQTMEHVSDLRKAIQEISRVGESGYFESPTMASEMLFPHEVHRWVFDNSDGKLVAKPIIGFNSPFGKIMHNLYAERDDLKIACSMAYPYFNVCRVWSGTLDCETKE